MVLDGLSDMVDEDEADVPSDMLSTNTLPKVH